MSEPSPTNAPTTIQGAASPAIATAPAIPTAPPAAAVPASLAAPPAAGAYGPFARWLLKLLFGPVAFPKEAVEPLRALAKQATLVYVLRSSALLHLLFFNWTFWRHELPIARAATGLGYRIFAPFARW